jgi:hypothetical protein
MKIAAMRRTQDRSQMNAKQLAPIQTEPDCAHAQKGVLFRRQAKAGRLFIAPDIECPDDNRPPTHGHPQGLEGLELLLLPRNVIPVHEEELRSEEPDSFGSFRQGARGIGGVAEVREDANGVPVFRDGRLVTEPSDSFRFVVELLLAFAEFPQGVRGGVQPKFAAFAVKCDDG